MPPTGLPAFNDSATPALRQDQGQKQFWVSCAAHRGYFDARALWVTFPASAAAQAFAPSAYLPVVERTLGGETWSGAGAFASWKERPRA